DLHGDKPLVRGYGPVSLAISIFLVNFPQQFQGVGIDRFDAALEILDQKMAKFLRMQRVNYPVGTKLTGPRKLGARPWSLLRNGNGVLLVPAIVLGNTGIRSCTDPQD